MAVMNNPFEIFNTFVGFAGFGMDNRGRVNRNNNNRGGK